MSERSFLHPQYHIKNLDETQCHTSIDDARGLAGCGARWGSFYDVGFTAVGGVETINRGASATTALSTTHGTTRVVGLDALDTAVTRVSCSRVFPR